MILLENPQAAELLCVLAILLGFMIRYSVETWRFKRRSQAGQQLFKSYFHALVIRLAESFLMLVSVLLIAGGLFLFLLS